MGFNMLRKHVKVEPAALVLPLRQAWYAGLAGHAQRRRQIFSNRGERAAAHRREQRRQQVRKIRPPRREPDARSSGRSCLTWCHTSTTAPAWWPWVIFNEGWGQFDSDRCAEAVLDIDSTRIIDRTSGWHDQGSGELQQPARLLRRVQVQAGQARTLRRAQRIRRLRPAHRGTHSGR